MNGKLFTELINDETIVKLTDEMLTKKKTYKTQKNLKFEFIKVFVAAAAVVFMIGVVNSISYISNTEADFDGDPGGNAYAAVHGTRTDIETDFEPANEEITLQEIAENMGIDPDWLDNNNIRRYWSNEYISCIQFSAPFDGTPANPDDLISGHCVLDDNNSYGVGLKFCGVQQSFDMADITDLKLNYCGEDVEMYFEFVGTMNGMIIKRHNTGEIETMFWKSFDSHVSITVPGLQLNGSYRGVPFTSQLYLDSLEPDNEKTELQEIAERLGVDLNWLDNNNINHYGTDDKDNGPSIQFTAPFDGTPANPDDLISALCTLDENNSTYIMSFYFNGVQQSFDISDVTDWKLNINGEETEMNFKFQDNFRTGWIHEWTETGEILTMFSVFFKSSISITDTSALLTGKYRGIPFSSEISLAVKNEPEE